MALVDLLPWHHESWQALLRLPDINTASLYLYGASGHGKRRLALAYAQWLLCEQRPRGLKACGHCAGCKLSAAGQHPDLRIIVPASLSNEVETIDRGRDFAEIVVKNPSQEIRIDEIRSLNEFAYMASHRGGPRVVLLWPAQVMNINASNALLKTLEEPPAGLGFILIGRSIAHVLPTIRSRCKLMAIPACKALQAVPWLQDQSGLDKTSAEKALALAGHAPLLACQLFDKQNLSLREAWLDLLVQPQIIDAWKQGARFEPLGIAVLTELAQRLLYDISSYRLTGICPNFVWMGQCLDWTLKVNNESIAHLQTYLLNIQKTAGHPLNTRLVIEALLLRWQNGVQYK